MKEANVYPLSALDGELSRRFHDAAEVPFDADWVGAVGRLPPSSRRLLVVLGGRCFALLRRRQC